MVIRAISTPIGVISRYNYIFIVASLKTQLTKSLLLEETRGTLILAVWLCKGPKNKKGKREGNCWGTQKSLDVNIPVHPVWNHPKPSTLKALNPQPLQAG